MDAKGKLQPDGRYAYTCGNCNGKGRLPDGADSVECPHCHDLDLPILLKQFETAKGQRYYAIWKAILSLIGKSILDEFHQVVAETGNFSPADMCRMLVKFGLPNNRMKAMAEWLEEARCIPTGMYEHLQERGFKVSKAMAKLGLRQEASDGR